MTHDDEAEAAARPLVGIYFQTSRKHRLVARFPDGIDPMSALTEAARHSRPWDIEEWVRILGPQSAGDHYLRCYAPERDKLELDRHVFEAYLKLGGGTYDGRMTPRAPMPEGWLRELADALERERMRDPIVSSAFDAARAFGWGERRLTIELVKVLSAERERLINVQLQRMMLAPVPVIAVEQDDHCPECDGEGMIAPTDALDSPTRCRNCDGKGRTP